MKDKPDGQFDVEEVVDVRVAYDSTGPHLEYYLSDDNLSDGIGYPIDEITDHDAKERLLFLIRNGKFANKP